MNSLESNLFQAMDVLIDKSLSEAKFDRTIIANVVECIDKVSGQYKVKYQDVLYTVSSDNSAYYSKNTEVYVLVPMGDFSNPKKILGTVKKLGASYANAINDENYFEPISGNLLKINDIELSSYYSEKITIDKEIAIPYEEFEHYMEGAEYLLLSAEFKTNLPKEQQSKGDYGIAITLKFKNTLTEAQEEVKRTYYLTVDNMVGQPYNFIRFTTQSAQFPLDNMKFVGIDSFEVYVDGFPIQKNKKPEEGDIFIRDIQLVAATKLDETALSGYHLSLITPLGTIFPKNSDLKELLFIPEIKIKGEIIKNSAHDVKFYWFIERGDVDLNSEYYNAFGGQGWKCLNEKDVIKVKDEVNGDYNLINWFPGVERFSLSKDEIKTKELRLKCICQYGEDVTMEKIVTISNPAFVSKVMIDSTSGTQFYCGVGTTDLICTTTTNGNFKYYWSKSDPLKGYDNLESYKIENSSPYIEDNKIHGVLANSIVNFVKYSCEVYELIDGKEVYYGGNTITLLNSSEQQKELILVINNGGKLFKYDTGGKSPTSRALEVPLKLDELTFTLYDEQGVEISQEVVQEYPFQWMVPNTSTLLYPHPDMEVEKTEGYDIIKQTSNLKYNLKEQYLDNTINNTILLELNYQGKKLLAKSSFSFVKDGDAGSNGTDYFCRIVPNIRDDLSRPSYPKLTFNCAKGSGQEGKANATLNFSLDTGAEGTWDAKTLSKWFEIELWQNGERVKDVNTGLVKWEILKNTYKDKVTEPSFFNILANNYSISDGVPSDLAPRAANIIKATLTYKGKTYVAILPLLIEHSANTNYSIDLKPGTGFRQVLYDANGENPTFSPIPFEIELRDKNKQLVDISQVEFTYTAFGDVNGVKPTDDHFLTIGGIEDNVFSAIPKNVYDGRCINTGINVEAKYQGLIFNLTIPIYFFINKYGLATLNGWDGNTLEIDEDGQYIMSPQIGAGKKESDNSFTGVVMGSAVDNSGNEDIGLLGYNKGQRTIFLDAETGKAEFGKQGAGQIILDPTDDIAKIQSGNYSSSGGMLIDFTTPEIKFGTGNFAVDSNGYLTAKGISVEGKIDAKEGTIGGFTVNENSLTGSGVTISPTQLKYGSAFIVDSSGKLSASNVDISGGSLTIGSAFSVNSSGKLSASNVDISGGSLSIGSNFVVNSNGVLTAKSANITGTITATGGTIGGCSISSGVLQVGNANINSLAISKLTYNGAGVSPSRISYLKDIEVTAGSKSNVPYISKFDRDGGKITPYQGELGFLTSLKVTKTYVTSTVLTQSTGSPTTAINKTTTSSTPAAKSDWILRGYNATDV